MISIKTGKTIKDAPKDFEKVRPTLKRKRMASAISLGNSAVCSILGIVYLFGKYPNNRGLPYFPMDKDALQTVIYGKDDFATLCCIFFGTSMVSDLVLGILFYRRHMGFLTGYFHHTMFSWLMIFAITSNGLITHTATPFAPAFSITLIEEIPTFILNLGVIFPACRSDLGFGLTFFALRVVFHSVFLGYLLYHNAYPQLLVLGSLTLAIHMNWFWRWLNGQGRKVLSERVLWAKMQAPKKRAH